MKYYCSETSEVIKDVSSSENGLTVKEAAVRLEANGKTDLKRAKK